MIGPLGEEDGVCESDSKFDSEFVGWALGLDDGDTEGVSSPLRVLVSESLDVRESARVSDGVFVHEGVGEKRVIDDDCDSLPHDDPDRAEEFVFPEPDSDDDSEIIEEGDTLGESLSVRAGDGLALRLAEGEDESDGL